MYDEWHGKPISISTVSSGNFGGSQALVSLQFTLWKIGALTVTNMFPVSNVEKAFDENGKALDKVTTDKLAATYIEKLLECVNVNKQTAIV